MLKVVNSNPFGSVYSGDVVDVMDTETGELYPNGILGSTWVDETGIHEGREGDVAAPVYLYVFSVKKKKVT